MTWQIREGDALAVLRTMESDSVDCVVTSPPYWGLRDYGVDGQLGLEPTPEAFLESMVAVFREVRRVLKPTGTCWVNMGDSYAGARRGGHPSSTSTLDGSGSVAPRISSRRRDDAPVPRSDLRVPGLKPKDLVGMPWRLALALQAGFATCSLCSLELRADLWPVHNGHRICLECMLAGRIGAKVRQSENGWWLRRDIIWHKPNPMPESVSDRPTTAHESLFLLTKSERYFYDADAIREEAVSLRPSGNGFEGRQGGARGLPMSGGAGNPKRSPPGNQQDGQGVGFKMKGTWTKPAGRDKRSVWTIPTQAFPESHFATFPIKLVEPCILAGCPASGMVLDPFSGSGTTGCAALLHGRSFVGIELNPEYAVMARRRIAKYDPMAGPLFQEGA